MQELSRYCAEKIEFSRSFIYDLVFSVGYVVLTGYLYVASAHSSPTAAEIGLIVVLVLCAQAAKVTLMVSLDRRGGEASSRRSPELVTDGLYGYSRNPAYLITIAQNVAWSLFLLYALADAPAAHVVIGAVVALPLLHFIALDRLIRREETDLQRWHPAAFAAYTGRVGRWIGRRRAASEEDSLASVQVIDRRFEP